MNIMTNKALIDSLKQAMYAEEKAIPIYAKHLDAAVQWTGLSQKDVENIQKVLRQLAGESDRHRKTVEAMIKELEGSA